MTEKRVLTEAELNLYQKGYERSKIECERLEYDLQVLALELESGLRIKYEKRLEEATNLQKQLLSQLAEERMIFEDCNKKITEGFVEIQKTEEKVTEE